MIMIKRNFLIPGMVLAAVSFCLGGCTGPFEESGVVVSVTESEEDLNATNAPVRKDEISVSGEEGAPSGRLVSVGDVSPYVTIGAYSGLRLTAPGVSGESVEEEIRSRLEADADTMKKQDTVQEGDTVLINYDGTLGFEILPACRAMNYHLTIGSGEMVPGFEQALIGMKRGDSRQFRITYPDEAIWENLRGQAVDFSVTLQSFTRPAALTEEWAKSQGYDSVQAFRDAVRAELEEKQALDNTQMQELAWQMILDRSAVMEYPEADMAEARVLFDALMQRYADQGQMTLQEFIASQRMSGEDYSLMAERYARERVTQNLILQGIMDAEGMTLDDARSEEIRASLASRFQMESVEALEEAFGRDEVDVSVARERVMDVVLASAEGSEGALQEETVQTAETEGPEQEAAAE